MIALPPGVPPGQAAAADSLRRALQEVFARPPYAWVERRDPLQFLLDQWHGIQAFWSRLGEQHPAASTLLVAGLAVALLGLIGHLGWTAWRVYRATVERPAAPRRAAAGHAEGRAWRAEADALARAGRYPEALARRFAAALLDLEEARALTFHPSKTPAEYVGEARLDSTGRQSLADLVRRLYGHLFGARPADALTYSEFDAAADGMVRHVVAG